MPLIDQDEGFERSSGVNISRSFAEAVDREVERQIEWNENAMKERLAAADLRVAQADGSAARAVKHSEQVIGFLYFLAAGVGMIVLGDREVYVLVIYFVFIFFFCRMALFIRSD